MKNAIIQKKVTSMSGITPVNGVGSAPWNGNGTLNRGINKTDMSKILSKINK
ncbi:hypothetical protein [Candidatus Nitrosarchaeum limnium]|uniref:Uncharacterized protein n=1 Tax=Candidatus Nitrosarchaeum limnium BG20 TaxID=859192 RepID=S2EUK4_9ARCH|nr:hypothetical protein [Candidatus Nitrosarchaeum limnium]EPA05984.1 hypothetical protein BG20_I1486 [Candidatus Nitrosarchaeum limnium BG20]